MHMKSNTSYKHIPKLAIFLHSPPGVELTKNKGDIFLKLLKNLYGLNDARRTWYEHLSDGLNAIGVTPTISACILTRKNDIITMYVGDCIVISKSKEEVSRA